jgi:hypothetical protein
LFGPVGEPSGLSKYGLTLLQFLGSYRGGTVVFDDRVVGRGGTVVFDGRVVGRGGTVVFDGRVVGRGGTVVFDDRVVGRGGTVVFDDRVVGRGGTVVGLLVEIVNPSLDDDELILYIIPNNRTITNIANKNMTAD